MNRSDLIAIRDVMQGDEAFILATWLKGLLYGGHDLYRKIPKAIYYSNHHTLLERILTNPATKVKVACLKEDPTVILGYSVYREAGGQVVCDWIFCKKDWRGIGIASSLLPQKIYAVTNLTRAGESILAKKFPDTIYNPYI